MGKARNIANLVDANGDVIASALDNVPAANLIDDTTPQLGGNLDVNGNAITGTSVNINASNGDLMITATEDGPVALRYDNNLKLTTKSDGVDITGELQADSLDIDGNADIAGTVTVQLLDLGTNNPRIRFDDSDTSNNGEITLDNTSLRIEADEDNAVADSKISFRVDGSEKAFINSSGLSVTGTAVATTDTDATNTGNITLDFGANQNFVLTLTGNVTLDNPTTEQVGQSGFIVFIQDGTGGRTVSLGTDYETAGGAGLTLSSTASATDIVPYVVAASGRILLGAPQLAFA